MVGTFLRQCRNADVKCAARGSLKVQDAKRKKSLKIRHLGTIAQLCRTVSSQKACIDNREKIVKQQYLLHMSSQWHWHNIANFGPLKAKFHYASWFEPASNQLRTSSKPTSVMEFGFNG